MRSLGLVLLATLASGCGLVLDLDPRDDAGLNPRFDGGTMDASARDGGPECLSLAECDDGNACNGAEACVEGTCVTSPALDCSDEIDCTVDSCDASTGLCVNAPSDALCADEDGIACSAERCDATSGCFVELHHELCEDGIFCTVDSCDPVVTTGCVHMADHELCGGLDPFCNPATGGCGPEGCEIDADCFTGPCTTGSCVGGVCTRVSVGDDVACDDDNPCTPASSCQGGVCRGIESRLCPGQPCVICNPAAAGCDGTLSAPVTATCSDRDLCTHGDHCDGSGSCVFQDTTTCLPGQCFTSACDPGTGSCVPTIAVGDACNDGDDCTQGETCTIEGRCAASRNACSPDGNPCTSDLCQRVGGCTYPAVPAGTACGMGGTCSGNTCIGGTTCGTGSVVCANGACCPIQSGICGAEGCVLCNPDEFACPCDPAQPCYPRTSPDACPCRPDDCALSGTACSSTEQCCVCPTGASCQPAGDFCSCVAGP